MLNVFAEQYLSKLRAYSPHYLCHDERQAGKLSMPFFKSCQRTLIQVCEADSPEIYLFNTISHQRWS